MPPLPAGSASTRVSSPSWVLVSGGFHFRGGMDKANASLAAYLATERRAEVHLVGHFIDDALREMPNLHVHNAPRPLGSYLLGEGPLARLGQRVARDVLATDPHARVVVNGGNCPWPDINWVHSVHHAWPCDDAGAPSWFQVKNRLTKHLAKSRERRALLRARVIIANSDATRRNILKHMPVRPDRVQTIYLGADIDARPASQNERLAARAHFGMSPTRPLVGFIGSLGHDNNKGLDTLLGAWRSLCARASWDCDLVVAGEGRALTKWQAAASGLGQRVRFLGFCDRIPEMLAAIDLLVSPSRYEAYGLNVHEAICRGVPAIVSRNAGVAERYPAQLADMLLTNPRDAAQLQLCLLNWRSDVEGWARRFAPLAQQLREHSWTQMACQIASLCDLPWSDAAHVDDADTTRSL